MCKERRGESEENEGKRCPASSRPARRQKKRGRHMVKKGGGAVTFDGKKAKIEGKLYNGEQEVQGKRRKKKGAYERGLIKSIHSKTFFPQRHRPDLRGDVRCMQHRTTGFSKRRVLVATPGRSVCLQLENVGFNRGGTWV